MSEDARSEGKHKPEEPTENLLARRQLFRKTSTELTIVKDGDSRANDSQGSAGSILPDASLPALPKRDTNADRTTGPNGSVSKPQYKPVVHGHIRSPLSDTRNSYSTTSISNGLKLSDPPSISDDLESPAALQERLQLLCFRTDGPGPASPKSTTYVDQGRSAVSLGRSSEGAAHRPKGTTVKSSFLPDDMFSSEFSSSPNLALNHPNQRLAGQQQQQSSGIGAAATLKLRVENIRSSMNLRGTGPAAVGLPSFRFSPLTIRWPTDGGILQPGQSPATASTVLSLNSLLPPPPANPYAAASSSNASIATHGPPTPVRTTGTTPVFIYMEDDTCSMFTVVPNATVNEVRMEALQKLGFMEMVESYRVYRMETSANGDSVETRIDPNIAIDYLTPPAPETIKLRMRRKSTIKWSIPVVVDERVQRTRWIIVEEVTSVEDVVRVLCTVEGKEDPTEWRLYKDGGPQAMAMTDKPFAPWTRNEVYTLKPMNAPTRRHKLHGLLGLPSTMDMSALATQERDAAQDVKRRNEAQRSSKLSYILGIDDSTVPDAVNGDANRRGGRRSISGSNESETDVQVSQKHTRSRSVSERGSISGEEAGGARERKRSIQVTGKKFNTSENFRHTVAGDAFRDLILDEDEPTVDQERGKRAEKLADFFGIAKQKHVDQLHGIIKKQNNTGKAERMAASPETQDITNFTVRIYFGNLTYSGIRLPVQATATHAKGLLLTKLMINNSGEQFGLFVHAPQGVEREMTADERLYNVMLKWSQNEYFLFKQRPVKNLLRHKRIDSMQSADSLMSLDEVSDAKRVAKLAGFFGIDPQQASSASICEPGSEASDLQKIFTVLATSGSRDGMQASRKSFSASGNSVSGSRPFALSTVLYKEGWIHCYQGVGKKSWVSNWAKLDNGQLVLRPNLKDEAITVETAATVGATPPLVLANCTVKSADFSLYKRPHVFTVTAKDWTPTSVGGRVVLCARNEAEAADWINCIKVSGRVGGGGASTPTTSNWSDKSLPQVPSDAPGGTEERIAPAALPATTDKGMSMADFELHRVIGRGKFAKVLLCSRRSTQKVYAIKVLTKRHSLDPRDPSFNPVSESQILRSIHHPFIVGLHYAFQSADRLYLVMEYINGGELYFHIAHYGRFCEDRARFYAAELLLGLMCLHGKGIVYRDLKLENILLTKDGHVKITDFGLSKQENEGGDAISMESAEEVSVVGTLEYLAPEVLYGYQHTAAADIWALGVVIFEMLCAFHPFYSDDRQEIQDNIVTAPIDFPAYVSPVAQSLMRRVLERDPDKRITGADMKKHVFFKGIDWEKLFNKELPVPFVPQLTDELDVSFFEDEFTTSDPSLSPADSMIALSSNRMENFSLRSFSQF
ncbi:RAC-gamma serine/threonine-protein kinase [Geranomyces variabilis]|nr:RAC-gamma serine/threonine-protein kinase [Geranomyces variabilis]